MFLHTWQFLPLTCNSQPLSDSPQLMMVAFTGDSDVGGGAGTIGADGNHTSQVLFTFPLVRDVELLVMQEDVDFVQRIVVVSQVFDFLTNI